MYIIISITYQVIVGVLSSISFIIISIIFGSIFFNRSSTSSLLLLLLLLLFEYCLPDPEFK